MTTEKSKVKRRKRISRGAFARSDRMWLSTFELLDGIAIVKGTWCVVREPRDSRSNIDFERGGSQTHTRG